MSEDIKKDVELTDEELEGVAGGYTREEMLVSAMKAKKDLSCPIEYYNDLVRNKK